MANTKKTGSTDQEAPAPSTDPQAPGGVPNNPPSPDQPPAGPGPVVDDRPPVVPAGPEDAAPGFADAVREANDDVDHFPQMSDPGPAVAPSSGTVRASDDPSEVTVMEAVEAFEALPVVQRRTLAAQALATNAKVTGDDFARLEALHGGQISLSQLDPDTQARLVGLLQAPVPTMAVQVSDGKDTPARSPARESPAEALARQQPPPPVRAFGQTAEEQRMSERAGIIVAYADKVLRGQQNLDALEPAMQIPVKAELDRRSAIKATQTAERMAGRFGAPENQPRPPAAAVAQEQASQATLGELNDVQADYIVTALADMLARIVPPTTFHATFNQGLILWPDQAAARELVRAMFKTTGGNTGG